MAVGVATGPLAILPLGLAGAYTGVVGPIQAVRDAAKASFEVAKGVGTTALIAGQVYSNIKNRMPRVVVIRDSRRTAEAPAPAVGNRYASDEDRDFYARLDSGELENAAARRELTQEEIDELFRGIPGAQKADYRTELESKGRAYLEAGTEEIRARKTKEYAAEATKADYRAELEEKGRNYLQAGIKDIEARKIERVANKLAGKTEVKETIKRENSENWNYATARLGEVQDANAREEQTRRDAAYSERCKDVAEDFFSKAIEEKNYNLKMAERREETRNYVPKDPRLALAMDNVNRVFKGADKPNFSVSQADILDII